MQPVIIPISASALDELRELFKEKPGQISVEPDPCPCCVHLIRALTAISRATTLIQAAQIAEGALRGDVGTATPDVV